MGFRNPITTAEDPVARQAAQDAQDAAQEALGRTTVLQSAPSGPRVRLTQTVPPTENDTTRGALEWIGEDERASSVTASSGVWGSSLVAAAADGASLSLTREDAPTGGKWNVAALRGDVAFLPADVRVGTRRLGTPEATGSLVLVPGWGAGSRATWELLEGVCWVYWDLRAPSGITANYPVGTLPVKPRFTPAFVQAAFYGGVFCPVNVSSLGALSIGTAAAGNNGVVGTSSFPYTP